MQVAQRRAEDRQCCGIKPFRLFGAALHLDHARKVVQRHAVVAMRLANGGAVDLQRQAEQGLGLGHPASGADDLGQGEDAARMFGMRPAGQCLVQRQGLTVKPLGLGKTAKLF